MVTYASHRIIVHKGLRQFNSEQLDRRNCNSSLRKRERTQEKKGHGAHASQAWVGGEQVSGVVESQEDDVAVGTLALLLDLLPSYN